jgi:SH3-like domain-containing protein
MRFTACAVLGLTWVLAAGFGAARAQNLAPPGVLPATPAPLRDRSPGQPHDQRVKPPAAAPRQPVHQAGPAHPAAIPVAPPHGPIKPHKPAPAAADEPKSAVLPIPPAAAPGDAAAEPKPVSPEKLPDPERPEGAPASLPRFASLRSDDVNMRAGPGTRYRIDWVYKRRDLPVEIEREFDVWRWVRDPEGTRGWVHQATLMGRRNFIVQQAAATLRSEASDTASAVAILESGVIGRIRSCEASSEWCNVQAGNYRGYLRRQQFWGLLPNEAVNP